MQADCTLLYIHSKSLLDALLQLGSMSSKQNLACHEVSQDVILKPKRTPVPPTKISLHFRKSLQQAVPQIHCAVVSFHCSRLRSSQSPRSCNAIQNSRHSLVR